MSPIKSEYGETQEPFVGEWEDDPGTWWFLNEEMQRIGCYFSEAEALDSCVSYYLEKGPHTYFIRSLLFALCKSIERLNTLLERAAK